jgi:hypothetical protein
MFAARAGARGRGRYAGGQWEVSAGGRATDAAVRMVTLHEIMHAELNDCTAWGSLFHAYGALVRYAPDPEAFREVSLRIIEACRRAHEVFATYGGVFLADRAAGRSLLTGRPDYLGHYTDACQLAAGIPDGSQLQWYAVISGIRACMQTWGLPTALHTGLDRFRLADLRARDLPDIRLRMLIEEGLALTLGIADEIAAELTQADRDAALHWLTCPPGDAADDVDEEVQDRAAATAERMCFDRAAAALERRGARVLAYNGHQAYTSETVAAVHQLAPAARSTFSAAAADAAEVNTAMQDFGLETLRVRDRPLPARVLLLSDIPRRHRQRTLRLKDQAGGYTFLVARSAGTLRSQHAITDDLRPLPAADEAPVVAIRTAAESALRLWQVARPRELAALRRQIGGIGIVSSVSMSLLADTGWEGRWLEPLLNCGPVTILMDLDPFVHFEHWAALGLTVRYGSVEATSADESWIAFACICRDPAAPFSYERATFLTVCSDMQADALAMVLQSRWPRMAHEDPDAIRERLDTIRIALSHLVTEETRFTFCCPALKIPMWAVFTTPMKNRAIRAV